MHVMSRRRRITVSVRTNIETVIAFFKFKYIRNKIKGKYIRNKIKTKHIRNKIIAHACLYLAEPIDEQIRRLRVEGPSAVPEPAIQHAGEDANQQFAAHEAQNRRSIRSGH